MLILEAKKLNRTFVNSQGYRQSVLQDIHLQIWSGEFVAIMGPSGSGKSTLLYSISGMDKISSGSVIFEGHEIADRSEEELAEVRLTKMGFIFQQMHLLKNLNIRDNIILSAYRAKKLSRNTINKRANKLMSRTGILSLADRDITQVSGGQLQRAAICRALINEPLMVIGDEPTGALNSKSAGEIMEILNEINHEGTTILLATHDSKVAANAERILYMLDGKITAQLHLGKYNKVNGNLKNREEQIIAWLYQLGF